jgi:uncharacterized protein with HEPN domain
MLTDNVDFDVVWEIVSGDLPGLVSSLDQALDQARGGSGDLEIG